MTATRFFPPISKISFILWVATAFLLTSPSLCAAQSHEKPPVSPWLSPKNIAIDPVLLSSDSLDETTIESLLSSSQKQEQEQAKAPSTIESYYTERLKTPIGQFGYESFGKKPSPHKASGAVQDSYILGQGDEVSLLIRGQQNLSKTTTITPEGLLIIEDLPPVSAQGRTIKDVRNEVQSLLGDYYNTDIYLSLNRTKQITVRVSGNVVSPGDITLTSFSSVKDAINESGGILKTGTLRQIKLIREETTTTIDLYGILIYGSGTTNLSLRDGDSLQIGPIGPTIAISGSVKRPAIYEILPATQTLWGDTDKRSQKLSLDDLLTFAGGTIAPKNARFIRTSPNDVGQDKTSEITDHAKKQFVDGDILFIGQTHESRSNAITLLGHTNADGIYALNDTPTLSDLLSTHAILGTDIYPLIGVIERWNRQLLSNELIAFSPKNVINKRDNLSLKESDRIHLFSLTDIKTVGVAENKELQTTLDLSGSYKNTITDHRQLSASKTIEPHIKSFLQEHAVFVRGSIRNSGSYPIAPETTLDSLLAIAGGTALEASLTNIEITQPLADKESARININLGTTPSSNITLHPGDTIRINQKFRRIEDRNVLLVGEIRNPGTYDLLPGDTLGKLLERAGSITEQAYPQGTIFSRKSERLREEQRYKLQAQDLELKLATALARKDDDKKPNQEEIAIAKDLIINLKNSEAIGRLTVEADPGILKANPEMDILLETGDRIYIPKRPLTVRVAGEVLSPASLQFRSGKSPRTYIDESGGFSYNADQDRTFVIYPNGSASPLAVSAWNHQSTMIPPGSTIIVPRDPKPLTFMDGAKDLSQILANLATTAIFADDLANGD